MKKKITTNLNSTRYRAVYSGICPPHRGGGKKSKNNPQGREIKGESERKEKRKRRKEKKEKRKKKKKEKQKRKTKKKRKQKKKS